MSATGSKVSSIPLYECAKPWNQKQRGTVSEIKKEMSRELKCTNKERGYAKRS